MNFSAWVVSDRFSLATVFFLSNEEEQQLHHPTLLHNIIQLHLLLSLFYWENPGSRIYRLGRLSAQLIWWSVTTKPGNSSGAAQELKLVLSAGNKQQLQTAEGPFTVAQLSNTSLQPLSGDFPTPNVYLIEVLSEIKRSFKESEMCWFLETLLASQLRWP